jgi:hypothetical protein
LAENKNKCVVQQRDFANVVINGKSKAVFR